MIQLLSQSPFLFYPFIGILGLMVGSFLNVVIYRLPVMMKREWTTECKEFLQTLNNETETSQETVSGGVEQELISEVTLTSDIDAETFTDKEFHPPQAEPFNLSFPASHCPACKTPIKAYQNIPVFSYIFLKGRCANCGIHIPVRYPIIEAFTAICSVVVALHFGITPQTAFALLLTWSLIALCFIDIDHQLLPDSITQPLLWLGIFLSLFKVFTDSPTSIIGAIGGYLALWSVYHLFKLVTGKEGMGYGDFKLLAVFGAWLGWQYLPMIIFLSSIVGAVTGISLIIFAKHGRDTPIPFGPYLAAAGWIALLWGEEINRLYLNSLNF
jgi:leader peptidase (prepilin peptidase)/N-methyltransferase